MGLKRKILLVSVYYYGDEPIAQLDDVTDENYLFLNDGIQHLLSHHNSTTNIFDVCIDEVKPRLETIKSKLSLLFFKLVRR